MIGDGLQKRVSRTNHGGADADGGFLFCVARGSGGERGRGSQEAGRKPDGRMSHETERVSIFYSF